MQRFQDGNKFFIFQYCLNLTLWLLFFSLGMSQFAFGQTPNKPLQTSDEIYLQALQYLQQKKYDLCITSMQKIQSDSKYEILVQIGLARIYYIQENYEKSIAICNQGLTKSPQQTDLLFHRAKAYIAMSRWRAAQQDLEEIRSQYPNNVFMRYYLGLCYQQQKRSELAKVELEISLSLYPNYAPALQQLGILFADNDDWKQSKEYLQKAISIQPSLFLSHYYLGQAALKEKNIDLSLDHLKNATIYNPKDSNTWQALAQIYTQQKNWEKALESYQKSLENALDPQKIPIRLERVNILYETQKYSQALDEINAIFPNLSNPTAETYYLRGRIYLALKQNKSALEDFETATRLNSELWPAYIEKARIHSIEGRRSQTISACKQLINLDKATAEVYLYCAEAEFQLKKYEEAKENYSKALDSQTDLDQAVQSCLGIYNSYIQLVDNVFIEEKRDKYFREAIAALTKAIAFEDKNSSKASYYSKRAELYYFTKQFEKAISDIESAIETDPKNTDLNIGYYYRSKIYFEQSKFSDALENINKSIEIQEKAEYYLLRSQIYQKLGKNEEVEKDLQKAESLGK